MATKALVIDDEEDYRVIISEVLRGAGYEVRAGKVKLNRDQIVRLCHRQRGAGADGLMLLIPCASGRADWAWDFYNSDGSVAEMCGNGARCFARFVHPLRRVDAERVRFLTPAGLITLGTNEGGSW